MATDRIIIHEAELISPCISGENVRAFCPIHGGDHQRSLAVQTTGEYTGFGECYNCHAQVLVREMNPEAAARIERARGRSWVGPSFSVAPSQWAASEPKVEQWKQDEHAILCAQHERMQRAITWSKLAGDYLAGRGTLPRIAQSAGVGYLSSASASDPALLSHPTLSSYVPRLYRWTNRIVFPLVKFQSGGNSTRGFIGRTLRLWEPGMDEDRHKAVLEAHSAQVEAGQAKYPLRRWIKTEPAGWWYDPAHVGSLVVMVEGGFDKLALTTAITLLSSHGICVPLPASNVIALAGTAASAALLPPQVQAVVLALDLDAGGLDSWQRLRDALSLSGKRVYPCPPPADGRGKDWAARWSWWLRNAGERRRPEVFSTSTLPGFLESLGARECELLSESVRPVFEAYRFAVTDLAA